MLLFISPVSVLYYIYACGTIWPVCGESADKHQQIKPNQTMTRGLIARNFRSRDIDSVLS